jgi:hypothetical protein
MLSPCPQQRTYAPHVHAPAQPESMLILRAEPNGTSSTAVVTRSPEVGLRYSAPLSGERFSTIGWHAHSSHHTPRDMLSPCPQQRTYAPHVQAPAQPESMLIGSHEAEALPHHTSSGQLDFPSPAGGVGSPHVSPRPTAWRPAPPVCPGVVQSKVGKFRGWRAGRGRPRASGRVQVGKFRGGRAGRGPPKSFGAGSGGEIPRRASGPGAAQELRGGFRCGARGRGPGARGLGWCAGPPP